MSVYIKGMEMPKMCQECVFDVCAICELANGRNKLVEIGKRRSDCPLIPVPPHGDLIDRDALPWEKQSLMEADEDWALPCVLIEDAPTIIPADKEGEGWSLTSSLTSK